MTGYAKIEKCPYSNERVILRLATKQSKGAWTVPAERAQEAKEIAQRFPSGSHSRCKRIREALIDAGILTK